MENWVMKRGSCLDQRTMEDIIGDEQASSCPEGIKTKTITGSQTGSCLGNEAYSLHMVP